jgi:hypothetical protein
MDGLDSYWMKRTIEIMEWSTETLGGWSRDEEALERNRNTKERRVWMKKYQFFGRWARGGGGWGEKPSGETFFAVESLLLLLFALRTSPTKQVNNYAIMQYESFSVSQMCWSLKAAIRDFVLSNIWQ